MRIARAIKNFIWRSLSERDGAKQAGVDGALQAVVELAAVQLGLPAPPPARPGGVSAARRRAGPHVADARVVGQAFGRVEPGQRRAAGARRGGGKGGRDLGAAPPPGGHRT